MALENLIFDHLQLETEFYLVSGIFVNGNSTKTNQLLLLPNVVAFRKAWQLGMMNHPLPLKVYILLEFLYEL